jgi:hypothetical protein
MLQVDIVQLGQMPIQDLDVLEAWVLDKILTDSV